MDNSIPWHDYRPGQGRIPNSVTHLRIGYMEYQQLMNGNAPAPIELAQYAFEYHPNLKQVQIYLPAVSRIGGEAFFCCRFLEQVEFVRPARIEEEELEEENAPPSQLISIGYEAFQECRNLKSVIGLEHAEESLQVIEQGAFKSCNFLVSVHFLPSLERLQSLGPAVFACNVALTTVNLSRATLLTELHDRTFEDCKALISVHLSPNLLRIRSRTFSDCSSLEEIHLPLKLQYIGSKVFERCHKLKSIVFPSSLQKIGENCFWGCKQLSQVVLPSSRLPFLKTQPFPNSSCTSLSSLDLPNPVPRQEWPLVLEQFCKEDGIAKVNGGIRNPKNRNSIVWNFLCRNMAQLFIEDNAATVSRRRPASQL